MPIYEYKCEKCNKIFEILQKINSEKLSKCIYCQGHVEKLISLSSFKLKGSGWYVSDYKNKSPKIEKNPVSISSNKKETNTKTKNISTK